MEYHALTREYAEKVIDRFLGLYSEYEVVKHHISKDDFVAVVADSALFYIKYDVECMFMPFEDNRKVYLADGVCGVDIEELTPNTILPKYKHGPFMREVQESIGAYTTFVRYARFKGLNQKYLPNNMESHVEYVIEHCPKLELQQRHEAWQGTPLTVVVFEMKDINGKIAYAADAIRGKVHPFVLRIADNLIRKSYYECELLGFGLSEFYKVVDSDFIASVRSHKGSRRVARLQDNLKYFSFETEYFKEERDIRPAVVKRVEDARAGKYASIERIEYSKPEYRWKTEEYLLKIVRKHYKEHGVIYQHRPYFLHSSLGGQMSYDIFISGLNIAIEYQGKQHFEPVDYFGGEEAFKKVQLRDAEKKNLSVQNGVKLIYVCYWEEVTPELICNRIDEAIGTACDESL